MRSGVIFGVARVVCGSTERERLSCDNRNGLGGDWSRGWASSCPTLRARLELWQREMLLVLVLVMVSQHGALAGVQGGQVKHRGGPTRAAAGSQPSRTNASPPFPQIDGASLVARSSAALLSCFLG